MLLDHPHTVIVVVVVVAVVVAVLSHIILSIMPMVVIR